jgi:hypothetical protein
VLHADASGRIRVLYPITPGTDVVPGGRSFEVAGAGGQGTFRILAPGSGLVLAIRSAGPLEVDGLLENGHWDYERALLFQPTAGNLFAALLDIADRVTGGRPYAYDQAAYATSGARTERVASGAAVCLDCFPTRPAATASDPSAAAATTIVDCSNSTLIDSFCGVEDNRSYVTETAPPPEAAASPVPVYVPVYVPVFVNRREHHEALDPRLRALPGRIVPPAPRRRPSIVVRQPRAPSHPRPRYDDDAPLASRDIRPLAGPPAAQGTGRPPIHHPSTAQAPATSFVSSSVWATIPSTRVIAPPSRRPIPTTSAPAFALPVTRSTVVPTRAVLRALSSTRP